MKLVLLIAILAAVAASALGVVVALYHHKKASVGDIKLIGELAEVDRALEPEGTVIVRGELWRAKSKNGSFLSAGTRVQVVGFENHLALVEVCDCGSAGSQLGLVLNCLHTNSKKRVSWHASCSRENRHARKTQCKG